MEEANNSHDSDKILSQALDMFEEYGLKGELISKVCILSLLVLVLKYMLRLSDKN